MSPEIGNDEIDTATREFVMLAKYHDLNPALLKDIIVARSRGLNGTEIATAVGVNKNTIGKYVSALGKMEPEDAIKLTGLACMTGSGSHDFLAVLRRF
jgi:hypothetical protein